MKNYLKNSKYFPPFLLLVTFFFIFRYSGFLWADSALTHFGINGIDLFPKSNGWIPSRLIDGVLSAFIHNISFRFLNIFFGLDFFEAHAIITSFFYSLIVVWLGYLVTNFFQPQKKILSVYIIILTITLVSSIVRIEGYNMLFAYSLPLALAIFFLKKTLPPECLNLNNSNDIDFRFNRNGLILLATIYLVAFSIEHIIVFAIIYIISFFIINIYKLGPKKLFNLFGKHKRRFSLLFAYILLSTYSLFIASNSKRIEVFKNSGLAGDGMFKHNYLNILFDINIIEPLLTSKAIVFLAIMGIFYYFRISYLKSNYLLIKNINVVFIFITLIIYSIFLIFISEQGNRNFLMGLYLLPILLIILSLSIFLINTILETRDISDVLKILTVFMLFLLCFHILNFHLRKDLDNHAFYLNYKKAFYEGLKSCKNNSSKVSVDIYLGNHPNEGYPLLPGKKADASFRTAMRNIYLKYYGCKFPDDGPIFYGLEHYDGYGPLLKYR